MTVTVKLSAETKKTVSGALGRVYVTYVNRQTKRYAEQSLDGSGTFACFRFDRYNDSNWPRVGEDVSETQAVAWVNGDFDCNPEYIASARTRDAVTEILRTVPQSALPNATVALYDEDLDVDGLLLSTLFKVKSNDDSTTIYVRLTRDRGNDIQIETYNAERTDTLVNASTRRKNLDVAKRTVEINMVNDMTYAMKTAAALLISCS